MSDFVITKNNLPEYEKLLESVSLRALELCGMEAERTAKLRLTSTKAVDTGLLRNSVTYVVSGKSPNIQMYYADKPNKQGVKMAGMYAGVAPDEGGDVKTMAVGTNVEYAQYIENGTSRMAARPFIRPAIADNTDKFKRIIQQELKKG